MPSGDCFSFAEDDGLIETMIDLGDPVSAGQVIARIHSIGRTDAAPAEFRAKLTGLLAARHFPGLVKSGDCVAVVGTIRVSRRLNAPVAATAASVRPLARWSGRDRRMLERCVLRCADIAQRSLANPVAIASTTPRCALDNEVCCLLCNHDNR